MRTKVARKKSKTKWKPFSKTSSPDPCGVEVAAAKTNLGCSAMRVGPLYVDRDMKTGRVFLSITFGGLGGAKLWLTEIGWTLHLCRGEYRGTWE